MPNPRFTSLLHRMGDMHNRKSHDYASSDNYYSNFEFAADLAKHFTDEVDKVFATLIGIKMARIAELRGKGKTPLNESIDDSFLDLAVYTTLWASRQMSAPPLATPLAEALRAVEIQRNQGEALRSAQSRIFDTRLPAFAPHLTED